MVQPFIENAIWHGVRPLENRKGNLKIQFKLQASDNVICIVEDDGVGRTKASENKSRISGKSRGISIVHERLKIYNNLWKSDNKIVFEDLNPGTIETGTTVTIDIPVKRQ
ncbi:MAG: hypothetical protein HC830_09550 [Bacteroidetes bacterium]|nr:hypothetical protein [Bacteroidota bacterium]